MRLDKERTHEHLVTNPGDRRVPGKLAAIQLTIEFLASSFLQSNSKMQIAKTRSRS